ncbi:MAG: hypothetical protein GQ583_02155 [Methyloprofundus sp.]|nr:hypothetical protein [Methyloprofundus sp.]
MCNKVTLPFVWNKIEFNKYTNNPTKWSGIAGIYIFLSHNRNLLYAGQTSDFHNRLKHHEKIPLALRLGLQNIYATPISSQDTRNSLEKKLIQHYQPPLNTKLKKPPTFGSKLVLQQPTPSPHSQIPKLGLSPSIENRPNLSPPLGLGQLPLDSSSLQSKMPKLGLPPSIENRPNLSPPLGLGQLPLDSSSLQSKMPKLGLSPLNNS